MWLREFHLHHFSRVKSGHRVASSICKPWLYQSTAPLPQTRYHGGPPSLRPPIAVNYGRAQGPPGKARKAPPLHSKKTYNQRNMAPQSVIIPGLTLLNNLSPHVVSPRPEVNLITSDSQTQGTPMQDGNKKKLKFVPAHKRRAQLLVARAEANGNAANQNTSNQNMPSAVGPQKSSITLALDLRNSQDPRVLPSNESGGVPNPTPLYLSKALTPPVTLPQPRRILVIMDLNGTLLYRPNKRNPFKFIKRPHAQEFLNYCIETFTVAIWSSARPQNVEKMVSQLLLPQQRARCVVVWARDKFGLSPTDYNSRVQCYKRLTTIWSDPAVMSAHPGFTSGQCWDQTNTVLVDDSIEKARSEPYNILEIPEFAGLQTEPKDVLPQVHDYLNALCYQADISSFMRDSPFKVDEAYRLHSSR